MTTKFRTDNCTIEWHGSDDTTPSGHTIATGRDSLGSIWLWLFKGDQATDDAFVGSISVPSRGGEAPIAYGRGGGFAGMVADVGDTLAMLAARDDA